MLKWFIPIFVVSSGFARNVSQAANDVNAGIDTVTNSATKLINAIGSFLVDGKNTYDKTESKLNNSENLQNIQDINELRTTCENDINMLRGKIDNIANQVRTWLNEDLSRQKSKIAEINTQIGNLEKEANNSQNVSDQNDILQDLSVAKDDLFNQTNRLNELNQRLEQLEYSLQINDNTRIQQYLGLVNQGRQAAGLNARKQVNYANNPNSSQKNQQPQNNAQQYFPNQYNGQNGGKYGNQYNSQYSGQYFEPQIANKKIQKASGFDNLRFRALKR